jgi:putative sigma-54 modulation protein
MKLTIRTRHVHLGPEIREQVRRRIDLALGHVARWIRAVDVTIADVNGPRGGPDKQCRLCVRGPSIPGIVVEHVGADTITTVSEVVARTERAVLRSVARRRAFAA